MPETEVCFHPLPKNQILFFIRRAMPTMTAQSISLCTILYAACFTTKGTFAFTTGGATRTISAPIAKKHEWQQVVDIELPDTDLLFERIGMASPLAKLVMEGDASGGRSYR